MPEGDAITFENVTKRYGGGPPALDRATLSVRPREFLVIVGASGSGKTTLLQLVNRLSEPTAGSLSIGGTEANALDPIALRRRMGYVFQEVGLFPHMTVAENIAITPRLLGWDQAARSERVDELLDLVRLERATYRGRYPHELSGGQRQRVGVARALAARPRIVLMDEPFGALDPLTREALAEDYRRLHETLGLTTVMVTHDMLEALLLADRIVVMQGGSIVADDTPHALIRRGGDDFVGTLMRTPRRHAERLDALIDGAGP
jgi:osmoprotectant transport system ATP-binding protein